MFNILSRAHINQIMPYIPGKPIEEMERELGLIDTAQLASNENPFGPSPKAIEAILNEIKRTNRYPESGFYYLVEKLSSFLKIPKDQIIIGNGSNELIDFVCRVLLEPGDEVITAQHAFAMFKQMAQVNSGVVIEIPQTGDFVFDVVRMAERAGEKTKIIFIANPNNPTGTYVPRDKMDEMFSTLKRKNVLVVLDEAYLEYIDANDFPYAVDYFNTYENVFVLRSFSKAYGLAGLRIGYGFGSCDLIQLMYKIKQTFNVSRLAQVAARAALDDQDYVNKVRETTLKERTSLSNIFEELGLKYLPSQANFIMVKFGSKACDIYNSLLKSGVVIRPMSMYNLPEWTRVTIGTPDENHRFVETLKGVL